MDLKKILWILISIIIGVTSSYADKRIQTVTLQEGSDENSYWELIKLECGYDDNGRIASIILRHQHHPLGVNGNSTSNPSRMYDTTQYSFQWSPNLLEIIITPPSCPLVPQNDTLMTCILNSSGNVEWFTYLGTLTRFQYDKDNRISEMTTKYGMVNASKYFFEYSNKDVSKITCPTDTSEIEYSYTGTNNKSGLQWQIAQIMMPTLQYTEATAAFLLAGITGTSCDNLVANTKYLEYDKKGTPITKYDRAYSYEYDSDGYVKRIIGFDRDKTIDITYTDTEEVSGIYTDDTTITIDGRFVYANGGECLTVYDLYGKKVASSPNGKIEIPSSGIYILSAGTKTIKAAIK